MSEYFAGGHLRYLHGAWRDDNGDPVDIAPVVRCRDCAYYSTDVVNEKGFRICPASGMEITEMDFCSYGERRDNDG